MAFEVLTLVFGCFSAAWSWLVDLLTSSGMFYFYGAMFVVATVLRFIVYPFFASSANLEDVDFSAKVANDDVKDIARGDDYG